MKSVYERVDKGDKETVKSIVAMLKQHPVPPFVPSNPKMRVSDSSPEEAAHWWLDSLIKTSDAEGWFAMNTLVNVGYTILQKAKTSSTQECLNA